jgi:hypothetical protein
MPSERTEKWALLIEHFQTEPFPADLLARPHCPLFPTLFRGFTNPNTGVPSHRSRYFGFKWVGLIIALNNALSLIHIALCHTRNFL